MLFSCKLHNCVKQLQVFVTRTCTLLAADYCMAPSRPGAVKSSTTVEPELSMLAPLWTVAHFKPLQAGCCLATGPSCCSEQSPSDSHGSSQGFTILILVCLRAVFSLDGIGHQKFRVQLEGCHSH